MQTLGEQILDCIRVARLIWLFFSYVQIQNAIAMNDADNGGGSPAKIREVANPLKFAESLE